MNEKLLFKTWPYEEQTKMKHLVFADYFNVWIKILGKYYNLNYFDCFAGCGAYEDSDGTIKYGSPILAAQIIKKNNLDLKRKVKLIIIDEKNNNIENIKEILKYLELDIEPIFINDDFDKTINKILDEQELAPTFFFIDPFGFKIKMSTLKRIMERPKTEILLNFMFNSVNRFLDLKQIEKTKTELFGCDDWKKLCDKEGRCREEEIIDLYRIKLKEFSKYVCYYRLSFPKIDRTYYYLFHLTNNIKGCSIMKSCFAKYNRGRIEYRGKLSNKINLFDFAEIKKEDIKPVIIKSLDKPKYYLNIIEELIDEVIYLESDIYNTLKELEKEDKIIIKRDPELTKTGKKRESIESKDLIMLKT